jgi:hypothetical protein
LIDERRDRPAHRAADLKHLFQNAAAGIFQIDQDDVGIERIDPRQQTPHFADVDDAGKARFPQPLLEIAARIWLSSTMTILGDDSAPIDHSDCPKMLIARRRPAQSL